MTLSHNRGIIEGFIYWLLSTIVFKAVLNTLFFLISCGIYIHKGIKERSWTTINYGIGNMLYKGAILFDVTNNIYGGPLYQKTLIADEVLIHHNKVRIGFGELYDTVSRNLGCYDIIGGLSIHGDNLEKLLDKLDHGHAVNSVSVTDRERLRELPKPKR